MVEKLSKCHTLNEFKEFIDKIDIDGEGGGRKFIFVDGKGEKRTYSMNQIINRFESCVKKSITNPELITETTNQLAALNQDADDHVRAEGSFTSLRQVVGNTWYKIFHWGFNKADVLNAIKNGTISGRADLSVATINELDMNGLSPLSNLLMEDKTEKQLFRDVKELLDNNANVWLQNVDGETPLIIALDLARNGNLVPLKVLFSLMKPEDFVTGVQYNYSKNLNDEIKLLLVQIIHLRLNNCVNVLNNNFMDNDNQEDLLGFYLGYVIESDLTIDLSKVDGFGEKINYYIHSFRPDLEETANEADDNGNTPLHLLILADKSKDELSKESKELLYGGADLTLKNKDGLNPMDLAFEQAELQGNFIPLKVLLSLVPNDAISQVVEKYERLVHEDKLRDVLAKAIYLRDNKPEIPVTFTGAYVDYLTDNPLLPLGPDTLKWVNDTIEDPAPILNGRPKM